MTQDNILDRVRNSCRQVASSPSHVKINLDKLKEFAQEIAQKKDQIKDNFYNKNIVYPLSFESIDTEINFHCLMSMLQFGSGFRKELHQQNKRGAAETIQYGMLCMTLSGGKLDANFMVNFSIMDVENFFQIPIQVEVQHPTNPILKIGQDSTLRPLAEYIKHAMNECGRLLMNRRYNDFAAFVKDSLQTSPTAAHLVEELVKLFPSTFDDSYSYKVGENTLNVLIHKKAQLVPVALFKNLRNKFAAFNFPDMDSISILADNVVPMVLIKHGVLECEQPTTLQSGSKFEVELRALSIVAGEEIVQATNGAVNCAELDYALWVKGKEKEYKDLERHATRTIMY